MPAPSGWMTSTRPWTMRVQGQAMRRACPMCNQETDMTGLRLSEVVLRTTIYDQLCDFYSLLLAQPRTVEMTPPPSADPDEPSRISFFDFYFDPPYTQRIAIFECKDIGRGPTSQGLHHFQLRTPTIDALVH